MQKQSETKIRRVNLKLDEAIHRAARKAAIDRNKTLQAYIADGVIQLLPRTK